MYIIIYIFYIIVYSYASVLIFFIYLSTERHEVELTNLEPVSFKKEHNKSYIKYLGEKPEGNKNQDWKSKNTRNLKLGIFSIVMGYFTFIFYILTIFSSIRFMQQGTEIYSYIMAGILVMLALSSGILMLICLILNIRQSRLFGKISKGLILALISVPPVVLIYLALFLKVISEDH